MFAKVFKTIYYGSLKGMKDARDVFICLLTHADRRGVVEYLTEEMIAPLVGISVEAVKGAIEILEETDPRSRTPDEDGRRLVRLETGGWQIVNYVQYRETRDEETRREQNRMAQRARREKVAGCKPSVSRPSAVHQHPSAHAEADVEVEEKREDCPEAAPSGPDPTAPEIEIRPKGEIVAILPVVGAKNEIGIREPDVAAWSKAFPGVDVAAELRKMVAWLDANPRRRKTVNGIRRFIVSWLSREQNRGPKVNGAAKEMTMDERRSADTAMRIRKANALERSRGDRPSVVSEEETARFLEKVAALKGAEVATE